MTAAVEDCGNTLLAPCYQPEVVTKMKETQYDQALARLQDSLEGWNSELCPAMRDHIERKKSEGEDTSYDEDYDGDGVSNAEDDDDDDDGTDDDEDEDDDNDGTDDDEDEDDDNDGVPDVLDDLNEGSEEEDPVDDEEEEEEGGHSSGVACAASSLVLVS